MGCTTGIQPVSAGTQPAVISTIPRTQHTQRESNSHYGIENPASSPLNDGCMWQFLIRY